MEMIRVAQIALIVANIAIFAWLLYVGRKRKKQIEKCGFEELNKLASKTEIADKDCILLIFKHGGEHALVMRGRHRVLVNSIYHILSHDEAKNVFDVLGESMLLLDEDCENNDDDEPKDNKEDKDDE